MKKNKQLSVAFGVGLTSGLLLGAWGVHLFHKKKTLTPDQILENVRLAFKDEGPIEGAWIQFSKQPLQRFAIKTKTYTGGLTRIEDGVVVQYEFVADAYTGTILDIHRSTH